MMKHLIETLLMCSLPNQLVEF